MYCSKASRPSYEGRTYRAEYLKDSGIYSGHLENNYPHLKLEAEPVLADPLRRIGKIQV